MNKYSKMQIGEIAEIINNDFLKASMEPSHPAHPYLSAMATLCDMDDMYGYDTAESVVSYFLANASDWKTETAKEIKEVLKAKLTKYHNE